LQYTIVALCRNLEVSKAGYYSWRGRKPSARDRADDELSEQIRAIHRDSKQRYGAPNVHATLRKQGVRIGRKRVARLMKSHALRGKKASRRRVITTESTHNYPVAPNVLNRQFEQSAPNRAWAADITYFSTKQGWLYLAIVLDLFSRRVVGWSMSQYIDAELVLSALSMGIQTRLPAPGLLVHTDRGSQFACRDYRSFVEAHAISASMSRKRDCWDNAVVESFFASMKCEIKPEQVWSTRSEARSQIFEYIEVWYNRQRQHSSLGYLSPAEFEEGRFVS
jgi:transposase InsO family protein